MKTPQQVFTEEDKASIKNLYLKPWTMETEFPGKGWNRSRLENLFMWVHKPGMT